MLISQVSALPTVVAFKNGKVANKFGMFELAEPWSYGALS